MDGHNLLNLRYEEAMDLFRSSGAEVEILLSQVSTDKGLSISEDEPCDMKATEEDGVLHLNVRHHKHMDQQNSVKESLISLNKVETGCGGMNLIPIVQTEPSCAVSVENSSLNNIHFETAVEVMSEGRKSEMVSAPVRSKKQLQVEKHLSPVHSNHDGIRAVCCVLHAEDD
jgi:hypothetical protein